MLNKTLKYHYVIAIEKARPLTLITQVRGFVFKECSMIKAIIKIFCLVVIIVPFFFIAYGMGMQKEESPSIYAEQKERELKEASSHERMVSYTGVIRKVEGVSFVMAGAHMLMDGERRICLLTSREINLDAYINSKVRVTGIPKAAVEGCSSVLMVIKVDLLN